MNTEQNNTNEFNEDIEKSICSDEIDSEVEDNTEETLVFDDESLQAELEETENSAITDYSSYTREQLLQKVKYLINNESIDKISDEIEAIKKIFNQKLKEEIAEKKQQYVLQGGNINDFKMPVDILEYDFKEALKKLKKLKAAHSREIEDIKQENLKAKIAIIEKIKDLVNKEESINKTFNEFKELQKQWREIGMVPQANNKELWDTYNFHVERFYDFIKINQELRDLDLKRNYEQKLELCNKAAELLNEPDARKAFDLLQQYHERWREIGPVPIEKRNEIWEQFRSITQQINKKNDDYYLQLRKVKETNLKNKINLCEKAEEILKQVITNNKICVENTSKMMELQAAWKKIGPVPAGEQQKIFFRFKAAFDSFFKNRKEFYKNYKEKLSNNLKQKMQLCEQAEALANSTDWKKTTQELINLQAAWKKIGPVPRKKSDELWNRFRTACDTFFTRKNEHFSTLGNFQQENLEIKNKLIEKVEMFNPLPEVQDTIKQLREFQKEWMEIGYVPSNEKIDIQNKFKEVLYKHYDNLPIDELKKQILKYKCKLLFMTELPNAKLRFKEEQKNILDRLKKIESELALFENNIGFFSKSKGNAENIIKEFQKKIEVAKESKLILKEKLNIINNYINLN